MVPSSRRRGSLRFGLFRFEPSEVRLSRGGQVLDVQPKVLDALAFFLERPGQLVTKEELLAALWPDTFVGEEALTQLVKKLRQTLGDDARTPRFLETVHRHGYRFVAVVTEERLDAIVENPIPPGPISEPARGLRSPWLPIAAALALGTVLLLSVRLGGRVREDRSLLQPAVESGPAAVWRTHLREQDPAVSPDATRAAFAVVDGGQLDLWTSDLRGEDRRPLVLGPSEDWGPRFDPQGAWVGFTRSAADGGAAWRVEVASGRLERLDAEGMFQDWSPDGRDYLVTRRAANHGGWMLVRRRLERTPGGHPEGSAPPEDVELLRMPSPISSARFSPDGGTIAFTDERRLWWVPAEGGAARPLGPPADYIRGLSWSSDGRSILCDATWIEGRSNLWRVRWPDGVHQPLTVGVGHAFQPEAVPGEQGILFVQEVKTNQLRDLARHRSIAGPPSLECFAWAASPERILGSDTDAQSGEASLFEIEPRTGDRRPLAAGLCPAVDTDGRRAAYWGSIPANAGLWVLDLESNERLRLWTPPPAFHAKANRHIQPAWSPDGEWLVFQSPQGHPEAGLLLISTLDEEAARPPGLLWAGDFGPPAWSPDGRWIAAGGVAGQAAGTYVIDTATRRGRRLSDRRSYRSAPVWDLASQSVGILIDETTVPTLRFVDLTGRFLRDERLLDPERDSLPSFWGLFTLARAGKGWIGLVEHYEGDLVVLGAPG